MFDPERIEEPELSRQEGLMEGYGRGLWLGVAAAALFCWVYL